MALEWWYSFYFYSYNTPVVVYNLHVRYLVKILEKTSGINTIEKKESTITQIIIFLFMEAKFSYYAFQSCVSSIEVECSRNK